MTEDTNSMQDSAEEHAEEHFQRAGEVLAAARERKGLSLEQASNQLKISVDYLQALEACHYDQLPGTAFVRGYLRSYARLVGLDEEHILGLFGETVQADEQVARLLQEKPLDYQRMPGGRWVAIASLIVVAALVMGSVAWWSLDSSSEDPLVATVQVSQAVDSDIVSGFAEDGVLAANTVAGSLVSAQNEAEPNDENESTVIAPLEPVLAAAVPVPSQDKMVSSGEDRLQLSFSGDCWVEVRDSEDRVLFSDLLQGSSELNLAGVAPLSITFGNAGAVDKVIFNGESVTVDMPTTNRGIGRLTLG